MTQSSSQRVELTPGDNRIYLREQPAAYADLFRQATELVNPALPYEAQEDAAQRLFDAAKGLPVKDSERARYYALGLISCLVAQELVVPEKREALIDSAATGIIANHGQVCRLSGLESGSGLYVAECVGGHPMQLEEHQAGPQLAEALLPLVQPAYSKLSVAERLVANALTVDEKLRLNDLALFDDDIVHVGLPEILSDDPALRDVVDAAFTGAELLLKRALSLRAGRDFMSILYWPLTRICPPDEVPVLVPSLASRRGASMRLDQLDDLDKYVSLDNEGHLRLARIPAASRPPLNDMLSRHTLHQETLICPAMEARAETPDNRELPLVPLVVPILGETILRAHRRIVGAA